MGESRLIDLLLQAIKIAGMVHSGQEDRGGQPYILHAMRVAAAQKDRNAQIVGMLHDVVEDSDLTLGGLGDMFPDEIIEALDCLTKKSGEDYQEYLQRVASNEIAIQVKLADLDDNMNLDRLPQITARDIERYQKYREAKKYLLNGK